MKDGSEKRWNDDAVTNGWVVEFTTTIVGYVDGIGGVVVLMPKWFDHGGGGEKVRGQYKGKLVIFSLISYL